MASINSKGSTAQPRATVEEHDKVTDNRLAIAQGMSEEDFSDAEKRLKRKLDLRLLACVWLIFVLNYLDRVSVQRPILARTSSTRWILICNQTEQHRSCEDGRYIQDLGIVLDSICDCSGHLFRWLHSSSDPLEHVPGWDSSLNLSSKLYGLLGPAVGSHGCRAQRCWSIPRAVLSWNYRGCISA